MATTQGHLLARNPLGVPKKTREDHDLTNLTPAPARAPDWASPPRPAADLLSHATHACCVGGLSRGGATCAGPAHQPAAANRGRLKTMSRDNVKQMRWRSKIQPRYSSG